MVSDPGILLSEPIVLDFFPVDSWKSGIDILRFFSAGVAQLVEHHVANVNVESSNLFARSTF
jgi:hypothetical protein